MGEITECYRYVKLTSLPYAKLTSLTYAKPMIPTSDFVQLVNSDLNERFYEI